MDYNNNASFIIKTKDYIEGNDSQDKLNQRIIELENSLKYSNECLRTAIEECEISSQELQSVNEELLVSNEELQQTNEEFQSITEELMIINGRYQNKIQELADLDSDMKNYLNSTNIGTIFLDSDLCIRRFTPSITKEINLKAQDIGRPMHDISHNLIDDELNNGANEIMNGLMPSEKEIQSKNGSWYLLKCAPYRTPQNSFKGVVISLVDITNRKYAELDQVRMKEKLNETILSENLKTEFFSNLSHELRTPLNVILSTLQLMDALTRDGDFHNIERKFKKYTNMMKQNCYRQLRLVNNLLDITKLDAGFFELNLQNCNIVNIVKTITLSVSEYIDNKLIDLTFDSDMDECIMACDPDKIERIILNLLSNSIKFTKPGGSMSINMHREGESVIIPIKDTGIGIPSDKLDIIFDRFRQVDRSLTRKQEGSGIGLSIVKSLVELHGGKISVFSEYGKETEFIIELPVKVLSEDNRIYTIMEDQSQVRIDRIQVEFSDIYSLN